MARDDWDIRRIECCTFRNDDEELESCDVYVWSSLFGAIRVREVENLLNLSRQRFVDLLNEPYEMPDGSKNKRHLITNEEESFRAHERHHIKDPYFTKQKIFTNNNVTVSLMDLEYWLDDNYNLLKDNNVKKNFSLSGGEANKAEGLCTGESVIKSGTAGRANAIQNVEKPLTSREKNNLLRIIHALVELNGKKIDDRSLAGRIAKKTQYLYGEECVGEDTVKNKLNEIKRLKE